MRKFPRANPRRAYTHRSTARGPDDRARSAPAVGDRPAISAQVRWSCLLLFVPLGSGLAVNYLVGWWPALAALLVTGVLTGYRAYQADKRSRPFPPDPRGR